MFNLYLSNRIIDSLLRLIVIIESLHNNIPSVYNDNISRVTCEYASMACMDGNTLSGSNALPIILYGYNGDVVYKEVYNSNVLNYMEIIESIYKKIDVYEREYNSDIVSSIDEYFNKIKQETRGDDVVLIDAVRYTNGIPDGYTNGDSTASSMDLCYYYEYINAAIGNYDSGSTTFVAIINNENAAVVDVITKIAISHKIVIKYLRLNDIIPGMHSYDKQEVYGLLTRLMIRRADGIIINSTETAFIAALIDEKNNKKITYPRRLIYSGE